MPKREQERSGASEKLEREETIRDPESSAGAAGPAAEAFTEEEMKAFAERLQSWGDKLPEREQGLLAGIVFSGSRSDEDVSGYLWGSFSWSAPQVKAKIYEITQDVTVNKAKTADKAFNAMDGYIRG